MLKLIVFDCDGVLFDSRESNRQFYNHLLRHFGKPPMTEEECDFAHIHSTMDAIAYIFRHYPELDLQEVDRFRLTCDYGPFLQMLQVERDLITFLDTVHPHYHLAISTNRTNTIEPLLQKFELRHYFGKVMTAQNAKRPKPARMHCWKFSLTMIADQTNRFILATQPLTSYTQLLLRPLYRLQESVAGCGLPCKWIHGNPYPVTVYWTSPGEKRLIPASNFNRSVPYRNIISSPSAFRCD